MKKKTWLVCLAALQLILFVLLLQAPILNASESDPISAPADDANYEVNTDNDAAPDVTHMAGIDPKAVNYLFDVVYAKNMFVSVGGNDKEGWIYRSTDGVKWTKTYNTPEKLTKITYGNGIFLVKPSSSIYGDRIYYSNDGIFWKVLYLPNPDSLYSCDFVKQYFLIFGGWYEYYSSPSNIQRWKYSSWNGSDYTCGATYGANLYVAVNSFGSIYVSKGIENWTQVISDCGEFYTIRYYNNLFLAPSSKGIYISKDAVNWALANETAYRDVAYGAKYIAVGSKGKVATSMNGINWKRITSGTTNDLYGVACGKGICVAVGANNTAKVIKVQ